MNYKTKDDTIIFGHFFNKKLEPELLKNYKKLFLAIMN